MLAFFIRIALTPFAGSAVAAAVADDLAQALSFLLSAVRKAKAEGRSGVDAAEAVSKTFSPFRKWTAEEEAAHFKRTSIDP